jgi:DNA ligase-1
MKPMLAVAAELSKLRYPVYVQPKLDGIRVLVKDGVVYSRKLKPIPNKHVQKLFGHLHGYDGELIVGSPTAKDVFQVTTSGVMSEDGEPDVRFWCFDIWNRDYPYKEIDILENISCDVLFVRTELVNTEEELLKYQADYEALGYEGAMARDPKGMYKFGRATVTKGELLKLKSFEDAEFICVGYEERMHNANEAKTDALGHTERSSHKEHMIPTNSLGALIVRWGENDTFKVGTGFTEAQRCDMWSYRDELIGKLVKIRFQRSGMKDKPRFPSFVGFRHEDDMSSQDDIS